MIALALATVGVLTGPGCGGSTVGFDDAGVVGEQDANPADANTTPQDSSRPPAPDASDASDAARDASSPDASSPDAASVTCPICTYPGAPSSVGTVVSVGLVELSGLAASHVHPDTLYAHNDSGDTARIFMIGTDGSAKNIVSVAGATAVDWEDIAVGPCPSGSCVFVGDIGDNGKSRTDIVVYRMPEPPSTAVSVAAEAFPLRYPDGAHDAETLMVDSLGAIYVVTKEAFGAVQLFAFGVPGTPGATLVGRQVASITPPTFGVPAVTGGDFFGGPCPRMLLRTYAGVLLFEGVAGEGPTELARRGYRALKAPLEQQGEAIGFSADGKSLFMASEGASVALNRITCGP